MIFYLIFKDLRIQRFNNFLFKDLVIANKLLICWFENARRLDRFTQIFIKNQQNVLSLCKYFKI